MDHDTRARPVDNPVRHGRFQRIVSGIFAGVVLLTAAAIWPAANNDLTFDPGFAWGAAAVLTLTSGFAVILLVQTVRSPAKADYAPFGAPFLMSLVLGLTYLVTAPTTMADAGPNHLTKPAVLTIGLLTIVFPFTLAAASSVSRRGPDQAPPLSRVLVAGIGSGLVLLGLAVTLAPMLSDGQERPAASSILLAGTTLGCILALISMAPALRVGSILHAWLLPVVIAYWAAALLAFQSPGRWTIGDTVACTLIVLSQTALVVALTTDFQRYSGQLRSALDREMRESQHLQQLTDESPIGQAVLDADGRFRHVNPALCDMTGYTQSEMLTLSMSDLLTEPYIAADAAQLQEVLVGRLESFTARDQFRHRSGQVFWVQMYVAGVPNPDGEIYEVSRQVIDVDPIVQAEESRERALLALQGARESSPIGWLEVDESGTITTANQAAKTLLEWEDVAGEPITAWIASPPPGELRRIIPELLEGSRPAWDSVWLFRRGTEGTVRVRVVAAIVPAGTGDNRILLQLISEEPRLRALDALAASEARFRRAMQASPVGMALVDLDGDIQDVNPSFARLLGYDPSERSAIIGQPLVATLHPDDADGFPADEQLLRGDLEMVRAQVRLQRRGGGTVWVDVSRSISRDRSRQPLQYIVQAVDITAERDMQNLLLYRSRHDSLTGLLSRDYALERLSQLLAQSDPVNLVGVFYMDLDRFQNINDALGHQAGDDLLMSVATRLVSAAGEDSLVGRLGGDEFVVIVPRLHDRVEAEQIASFLIERVAEKMALEGDMSILPSSSVGIALGRHTDQALDLLRDADLALNEAKRHGRSRWSFHNPELHIQKRTRLRIESELRDAVSRGEIETWYQPIADSTTRALLGYESLIRWRDPQRGVVMPSDFLAVAEETGLMHNLGDKVLADIANALRVLPPGIFVTVNASGNELRHADFREKFLRTIDTAQIPTSSLILEVTEAILLELPASAEQMLFDFDRIGVRIYLDDFGTGYSSIQHLRRLPISGLKLDRTFVREVDVDPEARRLAKGVAELAKALDLDMVAEGVESEEALVVLRDMGWRKVQGYLFGKPRPLDVPPSSHPLRVVR